MNKNQNTPETKAVKKPQTKPVSTIDSVDEVGGRVVVGCDFADPANVLVFESGKRWGKAPLTDKIAIVVGDYPLTGDYSLTVQVKPIETN